MNKLHSLINQVWSFATQGAVFSSPCIFGNYVFCGSHDKHLYCLEAATGNLIWKLSFSSVIYASPCYLPISNQNECLVCSCSSKGEVFLIQGSSGKMIQCVNTGGDIFSSPVMIPGYVTVGTRNNELFIGKLE